MNFLLVAEGYEALLPEGPRPGVPIPWELVPVLINDDIEARPRVIEISSKRHVISRGKIIWSFLDDTFFWMDSFELFIEPVVMRHASSPLLFGEEHVFFVYGGLSYDLYFQDDAGEDP